jgi:hypothetical protein
MKRVGSAGDIGIDTAIQIVIRRVIIETASILGLKGERKDPHEKRAAVAENTQNITSVGAESLPVDMIIPLRRNAQKPREISTKGGIEHEVCIPPVKL